MTLLRSPFIPILLLAIFHLPASAGEGSVGMASFYPGVGNSGEFTAAHRSLPFGTRVRVTRVGSNKSVIVRINDRGPFVAGRVIDVSRSAAEELQMIGAGVARVKLEIVQGGASEKSQPAPHTRSTGFVQRKTRNGHAGANHHPQRAMMPPAKQKHRRSHPVQAS
jgi:rare lipoprotein A